MTYDRSDIKRCARETMRSATPRPIIVTCVYLIITLLMSYLGGRLSGSPYTVDWEMMLTGAPPWTAVTFTLDNIKPLGSAIDFVLQLLSLVLSAGFSIYALLAMRRLAVSYANLLDGFAISLRVIWLSFLTSLFTVLWSMLLFFPGVIAAYSYRQAFYLMLDHPDWSCWRCIQESKALMRGHKWELFVLDLSFIGWSLLTVLLFPLIVFLMPYMELSGAEYYNRLIGVSVFTQPGDPPAGEKPPWEY